MFRFVILLFIAIPFVVSGQDASWSSLQKTKSGATLFIFGSPFNQYSSESTFVSQSDTHNSPVASGKLKESHQNRKSDSLQLNGRHIQDLLRLYNLGSDIMSIGVSDSTNTPIWGINSRSSTLDLRQFPKGQYNIGVATENNSFASTYQKDTDAMPRCATLDTAVVCAATTFEDNLVGTWEYRPFGKVKINADGTYEEIRGEIISNGPIKTRTWYIEDERMHFDVGNAVLKPKWKSFDCYEILFDGEDIISDFTFTRSTECLSDDSFMFSGAYPVIVDETDRNFKITESGFTDYTFSLLLLKRTSAVQASEYSMQISFVDNDHPNGPTTEGPIEFTKFTSSELLEDEYGLLSTPSMTVNALEVMNLLGVDQNRLGPNDELVIDNCVTLEDGRTFCQDNAPLFLTFSVYGANFNISLPVLCESNLDNTFEYRTHNTFCDSDTLSGTVELISTEEGVYQFSDWSFGAYESCYGFGTTEGDLTFTDKCGEITFTGFTDLFGDTWTFDSNIDKDEWTISWSNTADESGSSTIYYPEGADWPIKFNE